MPFRLRRVEGCVDDDVYEFIEQAHVHDIMDGRVIKEGRNMQLIRLV